MTNKEDFDHALEIGILALMTCGVSISDFKGNKYINIFIRRWLFFFNVVWLQSDLIAFIFHIVDGLKKGTDTMELSLLLPNVTLSNINIFKIALLYFNTDDLKYLYDNFKELHPVITDDIAGNIVNESVRLIRIIGKILIASFLVCAVAYCLVPIFQILYNVLTSGQTDFPLPFQSKYFFDTNVVFIYILVYIHQVYSAMVAGVNLIGSEAIFCAYCTFIQMHFRLLNHSFENELCFKPRMSTDKLVELVLKHRQLVSLGKKMGELFSKSTLIHMLFGSFLIAFCLFNLAITDNVMFAIKFFTFLMLSTVQIFAMCFFGDTLLTSSSQFSQAVYNSNWYDADVTGRKYVLFILMRSQEPCKISAAGFADLRMTTFSSILTSSYSYFALLKSMTEK